MEKKGREKRRRRDGGFFFCLELQPVSLAQQLSPYLSSPSSPLLDPQPQTESPVTVLMAALYSLSPPPPHPLSAGMGGPQ